jgi:hypothetical protein
MNYTKEQKRNILKNLPEDLKEAILSVETADKMMEIIKNNNLMLDQATELNDELTLFMLGLTRQKDFVGNVARRLNIDYIKAKEIAEQINSSIINSVRISLQKIQGNNNHNDDEQIPPPPTPVIKVPYMTKPAPVVREVPSLIEKKVETPHIQKPMETMVEKALPTPPPPTNLPGVTIPEKPNYNPFVKPIENQGEIDIKKIITEEEASHQDIAKIEEMGNFTIERHNNETHNDPYREPLI